MKHILLNSTIGALFLFGSLNVAFAASTIAKNDKAATHQTKHLTKSKCTAAKKKACKKKGQVCMSHDGKCHYIN
ncbi:hypothetical protein [Legionella nagasakiensis]|uniref:hypothetical protein n=1 Tax=Legionella nagasakiensis TaxID=535290 RepID=UPI001054CA21|nr:hypothetical protein [Legionella nagasakiensis]